MKFKLLFFIVLLTSLNSCNQENNTVDRQTYDLDNINVKEVNLYADHNSKILLDQLGIIYHSNFNKASIDVDYLSDADVMDAMLKDSIRLVVLTRDLSDYEIDQLKLLHQAKPLSHTFAYSAIALVRDFNTTDTIIDSLKLVSQLTSTEDVFVTTKDYVELFQSLIKLLNIQVDKHPLKIVNDIDELQSYLATNNNYIGILPFSIVSDQYDVESKEITKKFRWLGVKTQDSRTVYPSQSTIFTREWPLVIPYNIIHCNLSNNDGIGFVKFIHTKPASRLILKSGLIPYNLPDRDVKIEPQSFNL